MKNTNRIKIVSSILLLACFFLPFSSCTRHFDEDGKDTYRSNKPIVKTVTEYEYPLEKIYLKELYSWLFIFCFIWPIPILIFQYQSKHKRLKFIIWILEPLFLGGASYYIYLTSNTLSTPAIGAYLIQVAYFSYGISWLSEFAIKLRINRKCKSLTKHSSGLSKS